MTDDLAAGAAPDFDDALADGSFTAVDREGRTHRLPGIDGFRLMEILRDYGFDIAATCGGAAACGTCHVYVDPAFLARLPPVRDDEAYQLDHLGWLRPNSRLACQILWDRPLLDGLSVTLAPKE